MGKTYRKRNNISARQTERKLSKAERKQVRESLKDNEFEDLPDYSAKAKFIRDELK